MLILCCALVYLFAVTFGFYDEVEKEPIYCARRYQNLCRNKGMHVGCQFSTEGPGIKCNNYTKVDFTGNLQHFITQYINRKRQNVAAGQERVRGGQLLPKPAIMMFVEWDRELAYLAQRLSDQCRFAHDYCRATGRYPYAGQTVGEVRWRRTPQDNSTQVSQRAVKRILDAWWGEKRRAVAQQITEPFRIDYKGLQWGHFSQLAVWSLRAVGCGAVRHGSRIAKLLLVCDFSHTNMLGQRTITPGNLRPCPLSTARRTRSPYPILCAPIVRKATTSNEEFFETIDTTVKSDIYIKINTDHGNYDEDKDAIAQDAEYTNNKEVDYYQENFRTSKEASNPEKRRKYYKTDHTFRGSSFTAKYKELDFDSEISKSNRYNIDERNINNDRYRELDPSQDYKKVVRYKKLLPNKETYVANKHNDKESDRSTAITTRYKVTAIEQENSRRSNLQGKEKFPVTRKQLIPTDYSRTVNNREYKSYVSKSRDTVYNIPHIDKNQYLTTNYYNALDTNYKSNKNNVKDKTYNPEIGQTTNYKEVESTTMYDRENIVIYNYKIDSDVDSGTDINYREITSGQENGNSKLLITENINRATVKYNQLNSERDNSRTSNRKQLNIQRDMSRKAKHKAFETKTDRPIAEEHEGLAIEINKKNTIRPNTELEMKKIAKEIDLQVQLTNKPANNKGLNNEGGEKRSNVLTEIDAARENRNIKPSLTFASKDFKLQYSSNDNDHGGLPKFTIFCTIKPKNQATTKRTATDIEADDDNEQTTNSRRIFKSKHPIVKVTTDKDDEYLENNYDEPSKKQTDQPMANLKSIPFTAANTISWRDKEGIDVFRRQHSSKADAEIERWEMIDSSTLMYMQEAEEDYTTNPITISTPQSKALTYSRKWEPVRGDTNIRRGTSPLLQFYPRGLSDASTKSMIITMDSGIMRQVFQDTGFTVRKTDDII